MSLHSLLKDTWYMKLKAKRESFNNKPSELALSIPVMQKRNDNLMNNPHNVVVPSNTLHTYSQTDGDYIKEHTHNHMQHTVKNFDPKLLSLIKKSSPSPPNYTPPDDQPAVEGGIEGVAEKESVGSRGKEGEGKEADGESASVGGAEESVEFGEDFELFTSSPPTGKNLGNPAVWKPVNEAYQKLGLPVQLQEERQGASMNFNGKVLASLTVADLPELKKVAVKMTTLRDRLEGSYYQRVKADVKKLEATIKKLDPLYKKERVSAKKTLKLGSVGGGASGVGASVGGAGEKVLRAVVKLSAGDPKYGGGSKAFGAGGGGGKPPSPDDEGWEYQKPKGRGKGRK